MIDSLARQHGLEHDRACNVEVEINASARVAVTRKEPAPPPAVASRYYFSLPDPYEPLLAIWRSGYALDAITDDAIVLVAPEVTDDE